MCTFHFTLAEIGLCVSGASKPWFAKCHHSYAGIKTQKCLFSFLCWTQIVLCMSYASSCSCVKGGTLPGQVQHMIIAIMFASLTVFLQRYCVVIVNGLFIVDAIIYWH